jgi:hypothetical protein
MTTVGTDARSAPAHATTLRQPGAAPRPFHDAGEARIAVIATQAELNEAVTQAAGAARIASRHTAGLLYPIGEVERHLAPYAARYDVNVAIATKEREPNGRRRSDR